MPLRIPNEAGLTLARQAEPDQGDIDVLVGGFRANGVVTGCAVTAQGSPNMTVAVAAGTVSVERTIATVTAGNVTITTADATNPRIDLVVVDETGAKSAIAGTPAADPAWPTIPANRVVLARVDVPAGDTTIDSSQIIDKRVTAARPKPKVQVDVLAADVATTAPLSVKVLSGTFVPLQSEVDVTILLAYEVWGDAMAHLNFLYGTTATPLRDTGHYHPIKAGVTLVDLGKSGYDVASGGPYAYTARLAGLTPGATYNYAIEATIAGGLQTYTVPADVNGTAAAPGELLLIDSADPPTYSSTHKAYVRLEGTGKLMVINPQPMTNLQRIMGRPNLIDDCPRYLIQGQASMVGSLGKLAKTPDNTRVVHTSYYGNGIHIVDVATDTITSTITTVTAPYGIHVQSNTTAWVAAFDGSIYPITLSTGAVGGAYATGAGASTVGLLAGAPGSSICFHAKYGTTTLRRINLAGGPSQTTVTAPGNITALAVSRDGTRVYAGLENKQGVKVYDASTLTLLGTLTPPSVTSATADVTAIFEDLAGTVAYVLHGGGGGRWDYYYVGSDTTISARWEWYDGVDFSAYGDALGGDCSPIENIWTTAGQGIWMWTGSQFQCRPTNDFYNEFCIARFEGVA